MNYSTAIIAQVILLAFTLALTCLRCFVRLRIEARALTLSDYLVWVGWLMTFAFVICQGIALRAIMSSPLVDATYTDSVVYLKTVYASCYFFDIGLFMPKASIAAFYWWLVPNVFRHMRVVLWISTIYLVAAMFATLFVDIFMCFPVSDNWSLDYDRQGRSIWNSYTDFCVNWGLNFSADLLLFFIPFFIIKSLKLRQRQKYGLIVAFSLGVITMTISFARFMIYSVSDYDLGDNDGAVMCTAEMCTSLIVASLPGLKVLITRTVTGNTTRSTSGYTKSNSNNGPNSHTNSRLAKASATRSSSRHPSRSASADDSDEFELISVEHKGKIANNRPPESVDLENSQITVKHDFSVEADTRRPSGVVHNATSLPFV